MSECVAPVKAEEGAAGGGGAGTEGESEKRCLISVSSELAQSFKQLQDAGIFSKDDFVPVESDPTPKAVSEPKGETTGEPKGELVREHFLEVEEKQFLANCGRQLFMFSDLTQCSIALTAARIERFVSRDEFSAMKHVFCMGIDKLDADSEGAPTWAKFAGEYLRAAFTVPRDDTQFERPASPVLAWIKLKIPFHSVSTYVLEKRAAWVRVVDELTLEFEPDSAVGVLHAIDFNRTPELNDKIGTYVSVLPSPHHDCKRDGALGSKTFRLRGSAVHELRVLANLTYADQPVIRCHEPTFDSSMIGKSFPIKLLTFNQLYIGVGLCSLAVGK